MSLLPDWQESSRRGSMSTSMNEREEKMLRDTPLQNIDKRLKMLSHSGFQTPLTSHRVRPSPAVSEAKTPPMSSRTHERASRSDSNQQLSTIVAQRDAIHHKDLELTVCLSEVKFITSSLSNISEVVGEIESHISSEGGIDTKALLKLIQPMKKFESSSSSLRSDRDPQLPRELLLLSSATQKLSSDLQSTLQVFTQCLCDSSRAYQEQLAHARERSNLGTRNALQAEKAAYHSSLLQLKEQHTRDLRDLAEANMQSVLESESKIRSLTLEFGELRASSELVSELRREVQSVEERVERAAEKAREEERQRSERTIQEVREQCQVLLREAEETLQSRQRDGDAYNQEKLLLQKQHHEEMLQLLKLEREKVEQQNADLTKELQLQRDNFSKEKERLLQETATQRQRIESEVDELRSEHLQTVSALKAETATKLRQLKAEERQRIEEALGQFRREKEQLEADYAAEMDRTLQQHKASLTKLKAQLEVKHEDELKATKRRHENEVARYSSEIDRLRRLVARRGGGLMVQEEDRQQERVSESHKSNHSRSSSHQTSHRYPSLAPAPASAPSPTPAVTPQPHSRSTLTDSNRRTVNFHTSPSPSSSPHRGSGPSPALTPGHGSSSAVLRISDPSRSFSFSPTKSISLDWTELQRSIALQEQDLSKTSSPSASPSPPPFASQGSNKGGRRDGARERESVDGISPPPPPPPDSFPLEVAWQSSKLPGHNVSSNAAQVESYLSKLQRYLELETEQGEGWQASGGRGMERERGKKRATPALPFLEQEEEEEEEDITFPYRPDGDRDRDRERLDRSFASEPEQDSLEST